MILYLMANDKLSAGELKPSPLGLKKKRKGVRVEDLQPAEQSFTLPELETSQCSGIAHGPGVVVTQLHHIWALVKLGCYGKGMFSRSVPSHECIPSHNQIKQVSRKRRATDVDSEEMERQWKKRMKLHSQWKDEVQCTVGQKEGAVSIGEGEEDDTAEEKNTINMEEGVCARSTEGIFGEGIASMVQQDTGTAMPEVMDIMAGEDMMEECVPILEDTSVEEREYQNFISRLKAIKQDDPYPLEEYLQLSAEEAFYLAAEVGVLVVERDAGGTLTNSDLWLHFTQLSKSFCTRYAAYSHYRAGNWVPKSGLKFGVDFLLYKENPLSYHSSFAVVVREEGEGGQGVKNHQLTWKEVIARNRVCESAKKDLLMCHVTWPVGIQLTEPCCIDRAIVTDTLVKRWVPERDR